MKLFKDWIKNLAKRGFAAVLAASLVVTCYPESVIISYADPDTSEEGTTLDETTESSIGEGWTDTSDGLSSGTYDVVATSSDADEPVYKITKNSTPQTFKAFNNMETWMNRSYVSAPENTYSLTVATGATDGSKVLYFSINYKDTSNISRKQFLFPHVDAFKKSDDLLNYYFNPADSSTANSGTSIYDTYGSKVASQLNYKDVPKEQAALGAFTVQDYAFQTEAEIKTIESIDVYIEVGSWTIQGMSIYKVDRYKGMEEYGLMSGQTFFDFEGRCIADVKKKDENAQLTLPSAGGSTDTVTRIKKDDKSASIYIENHTGGEEFEKKFASDTALYTMRMDFSDVYEGGLETFLNKDAKSMKDYGGIVEDIAWEIQYKDVHGWTRKVTLPVLLSAYGEAMQSLGDDAIMGFAQRGDTIAFQGLLPDFSSVMGKPIIYVGKQATDKMASYGITMDRATSAMTSNSDSLKSDDLRVAGISIYEGGCMAYLNDGTDTDGNTVRGATIQYVFENSDPMLYQTTDQLKGRQIKYDGSESFKLSEYKSGAPLIAAEKGLNQFLVTVKTKSNSKTDAKSDLSLKLHYKTSEGQGAYTRNYKAKEASNDYMGLWPDVNGKNYLDNSGLVAGGSVSFLVEVKDFSEFTGAEITILGDKDWLMDNITISYVQTYDNRLAYLHENESAGVKSNFWVERDAITAEVFNLKGVDYTVRDSSGKDLSGVDDEDSSMSATGKIQKRDENGELMWDEETGEPIFEEYGETTTKKVTGDQVFNKGETYTISFDSENQIDVRTLNYADVRYSMTYDQTQMNWGFFKVKKSYDIAVEVAPDNDYDDGNGNSGSTNHFYFQLIFANGNSAYVLANQQLSADGFRSGREETFSININQDYGELSGVRIIPEDTSSDSDPFDKLNIKRITVSEQTSGGSYISYIIDQVGWIDIDYRDELESASSRGQRARTASELSKVYPVSYKERNVKLLCEIYYEPWSGSNYGQFIGSLKAVIEYERASDGKLATKTIDCIKGMADYLNTTVKSVETTYDSEGKALIPEDGLGTYSDPETMMRPNHTDRFFIPAISDLKSIKSITFTAKNVAENNTQWNIGNISISQVVKDGTLRLTEDDEYVRDSEVRYLCMSDNQQTISTELEINNPTELVPINFTYNEIVWSSEEWATPVSRVPTSEDDTVNIYVYPTEGRAISNGASMDVKLNYNMPFSQLQSISAQNLTYDIDGKGQQVFYKEGLSASGFIGASKLKVHSVSDLTVSHAVVQHLKSGTVIDTYTYNYLDSSAKNYPTVEPRVNLNYIDTCKEVLALSFGPGTPTDHLISEEHDIAVGFTYTSTIDGGTTEFQSPYVYLTDVGIEDISEGLFAEIPFDVAYVKEITGYKIAAYGNVQGNINNSCAQVYTLNKSTNQYEKRSYASFKKTYALSSRLEPITPTSREPYGEDSVTPVSMTFTTEDISKGNDATTHTAVKMLLKYKKTDGTKPIVSFQDITPYIQDNSVKAKKNTSESTMVFTSEDDETTDVTEVEEIDNGGFKAGEQQTVKFFLTDMSQDLSLISAIMTPYNPEVVVENENAKIDAESNESESTIQTILDEAGNGEDVDLNNSGAADLTQQILSSRNATWKISRVACNLGFGKNVPSPRENLDMEFSGLNTSDKNTLRLVNITMLCEVTKNTESKVTATTGTTTQIVASGDDKLYGNVFVVDPAQEGFKVKAYKVVGTAAQEVSGTISEKTTDGFLFTVPKNETESFEVYRIEVYPVNGPDLIAKIEVTVQPEVPGEEEDKEETDTNDPTKQKGEGNTEATTQATTEATTEATSETPAETQTNNTDNTTPSESSGSTDNNSTNSNSTDNSSSESGSSSEGGSSEGGSSGGGSSEGGSSEGGSSEGGSSEGGSETP